MPWTANLKLSQKLLNPSPTFQTNSRISAALNLIKNKSLMLDLGAGGRKITPDIISVDFVKIGDTKVIADLQHLPFLSDSVHGVFCTGTLEHVENPEFVMREINRVLQENGIVYIDVPFIQCFHPDPVDYWRFTKDGLELLCRRNSFCEIESGVNIGPASSVTWISIGFLESCLSNNIVSKFLAKILEFLIIPFKYLDIFLTRLKNSYICASSVYFIGKKHNKQLYCRKHYYQ